MSGAKLTPFLMFEGRAEAAMNFYVSLFPGAEILELERYGANGPGPEGSIKMAKLLIAGQTLKFTDSFVKHAFSFTPSLSLFVDCESESEIDRIYSTLVEGGTALMPLGSYGFSRKFGWVNDRFGVSWQINLA
jgi:predicted 3-demethylubiquinone-9 3-methyltransferase (glyoxalase superfamily)